VIISCKGLIWKTKKLTVVVGIKRKRPLAAIQWSVRPV